MKLDAKEARAVLRQCDFAALATQSVKMPGFPFLSHVPFALDAVCRPVLLLSNLAEHCRNLARDTRASLMTTQSSADPQSQPRLTIMGELRPFEPERALTERYLRYHPEAATWLGFGDFRFFHLQPSRARLVAGFARAGWIDALDHGMESLGEQEEAPLLAALNTVTPTGFHLLGLDNEGIDTRDASGKRLRLPLAPGESILERAKRALENITPSSTTAG